MSDISCGVRELVGLEGDPKRLIRDLLTDEYSAYDEEFRFSQVIFSDNLTEGGRKRKSCGVELAKFIRGNKLGTLVESRTITNRNTGNKIKTWIWNVSNLRKLKKAVGWKKPKDDYNDYWHY